MIRGHRADRNRADTEVDCLRDRSILKSGIVPRPRMLVEEAKEDTVFKIRVSTGRRGRWRREFAMPLLYTLLTHTLYGKSKPSSRRAFADLSGSSRKIQDRSATEAVLYCTAAIRLVT